MSEKVSKLQVVTNKLEGQAHIAFGISRSVRDHRNGVNVRETYIHVSPPDPTERSFEHFQNRLLHGEGEVSDWDRKMSSKLYAVEMRDGVYEKLEIRMFEDSVSAINGGEELIRTW